MKPEWMTEFRLKSLEIYNQLDVPTWGPDISDLDIDKHNNLYKTRYRYESNLG